MNGFGRPPPGDQTANFGLPQQQSGRPGPGPGPANQAYPLPYPLPHPLPPPPQNAGFPQFPHQNIPLHPGFPNPPQFLNQPPLRPPPNIPQNRPLFVPQTTPSAAAALNDKVTSIFVGSIPEGITDEWLQNLLQVCGNVKSWKRLKDSTGKPKGFGFCEFSTLDSTLRALRILTKGENQGIELPSPSNPTEKKRLLIKVDEKTQTLLNQYEKLKRFDQRDIDLDNTATTTVEKLIIELLHSIPGQLPSVDFNPTEPHVEPQKNDTARETKKNTGSSKSDSVHLEKNFSSSIDTTHIHKDRLSRLDTPSNLTCELEEETKREERHEERRKLDLEHYFKRKERAWADQESERKKRLERIATEELNRTERFISEKDAIALHLSNWDDKRHERDQVEEYYKNRERWWNRRKHIRDREAEADENDRKLELKEKLDLENRTKTEIATGSFNIANIGTTEDTGSNQVSLKTSIQPEENAKQSGTPSIPLTNANISHAAAIQNVNSGTRDLSNSGSKVNIKAATTIAAALNNHTLDEKPENNTKNSEPTNTAEPRSTASLHDTTSQLPSPADLDNRRNIAQELVKKIPVDPSELFKWNIRWEFLNEKLISQKLKPVILKRLAEYLGEGNNGDDSELLELAGYISNHLQGHKSPESLVSELEMLLDEDSSIFVARLWRILVFETEMCALKL